MYVRVDTPLLHDHLARVWRALIGTPFRIKVMDRRARVQRQALYPWDPLVCAVADIVTRERHLLIFEGTRSGSGYLLIRVESTFEEKALVRTRCTRPGAVVLSGFYI